MTRYSRKEVDSSHGVPAGMRYVFLSELATGTEFFTRETIASREYLITNVVVEQGYADERRPSTLFWNQETMLVHKHEDRIEVLIEVPVAPCVPPTEPAVAPEGEPCSELNASSLGTST